LIEERKVLVSADEQIDAVDGGWMNLFDKGVIHTFTCATRRVWV
jgi:hypothetical protein